MTNDEGPGGKGWIFGLGIIQFFWGKDQDIIYFLEIRIRINSIRKFWNLL